METALKIPATIEKEIEALIRGGYYSSKSEALKDAFRTLLDTKPVLKLASAIELYKAHEVSLARAAEIAGMTTIEFKDVLAGRGIVRETEGKTTKEMDKKLKKLGIV